MRDVEVDVLVDGSGVKGVGGEGEFQDGILLRLGEAAGEVGAELLFEERDACGAATAVADGVLDGFGEGGSVGEGEGEGAGDGAFFGVEVIGGEAGVFNAGHPGAELVDARVGGDGVFVVGGEEAAEEEGDGDHVLHAVIAVGGVREWAGLVDDAEAGLVRAEGDGGDVIGGLSCPEDLRAEGHGGFHGGLGMELGGVADFEEDVFHDVGAVGALELEGLSAEGDVVEAPDGSCEHGRVAHLAGLDHEGEADGAAGGVSGGPAFAGAGVGRVAVGAEALAVDPGEREGVDDLRAGEAEHVGDDGGGGDFDEHDVIEADAVEGVFESEAALDLVSLDHGGEDVAHGERLAADGDGVAGEPVGGGEDAAEVVGGVTPLGREPGVVEVEPADHGADVEGSLDGV